jgi:hypothetical protein
MSEVIARPPAPPLPATTKDMLDQRKGDLSRTLNDLVEEVHVRLYDKSDYRDLLSAVWDSEAVEGSLSADTYSAAAMIRAEAKSRGSLVKDKNLATISRSLGVVLRRFDLDRKTRRHMVDGKVVPHPESNGNAES